MRSSNRKDAGLSRSASTVRRQLLGLSAIELLTTITVAAILMAIAVPSYSNLIATNRVKAAASEIFMSLIRARSEAAKLNRTVTLTPISSSWKKGWNITAGSTTPIFTVGESTNVSITGGPSSIVYMSSGRIQGSTSPAFAIAALDGQGEKRWVCVDLTGRPAVKTAAC